LLAARDVSRCWSPSGEILSRKYHAEALPQAGICVTAVRFQETIHDFVMVNALAHTTAARGVIALATA
jgi:hypothetical protein